MKGARLEIAVTEPDLPTGKDGKCDLHRDSNPLRQILFVRQSKLHTKREIENKPGDTVVSDQT